MTKCIKRSNLLKGALVILPLLSSVADVAQAMDQPKSLEDPKGKRPQDEKSTGQTGGFGQQKLPDDLMRPNPKLSVPSALPPVADNKQIRETRSKIEALTSEIRGLELRGKLSPLNPKESGTLLRKKEELATAQGTLTRLEEEAMYPPRIQQKPVETRTVFPVLNDLSNDGYNDFVESLKDMSLEELTAYRGSLEKEINVSKSQLIKLAASDQGSAEQKKYVSSLQEIDELSEGVLNRKKETSRRETEAYRETLKADLKQLLIAKPDRFTESKKGAILKELNKTASAPVEEKAPLQTLQAVSQIDEAEAKDKIEELEAWEKVASLDSAKKLELLKLKQNLARSQVRPPAAPTKSLKNMGLEKEAKSPWTPEQEKFIFSTLKELNLKSKGLTHKADDEEEDKVVGLWPAVDLRDLNDASQHLKKLKNFTPQELDDYKVQLKEAHTEFNKHYNSQLSEDSLEGQVQQQRLVNFIACHRMLEELKQSSQKTPKPADKMKKPQQKDQESGDKKKKPHQKDQESGDKKKKPHQKDQESGAKEAPLQISILGFDMSEELDVEKFVHGFTRSQLGMYKLNMEEAGSKWTQYCRDNLSRPCEFDEWTRLQRISKNFGTCITIYNQAVGHNALEERSPLGLAEVNLNSNADADIFLASLKKNSPEAWNAYKEEVMRQVESIDEDRTQLPEKSLGNLIRSTMRWNYLQIQSAIARMEQRQEEALKPGPKANQPEETRLWSFGADLRQPVFATFHKEWLQQMEPEELVKYKKELAEKHSAIRAASREMKLNEDDALVLANCEECFKMIADIEGSRREDELPPAPKSEAPKDEEPEGEAFARLMKGSQEKKAAEEALLKEQAAKKPEAEEEDATLKFLSSQIVKSQPLGLSAETLELPAPLLLPPPPAVLQLQLPGTQGGQQNPDLTESQPGTPKDTSPQHSPRRDHKAPDERDAKMPPRLLSSASSADDSDSN